MQEKTNHTRSNLIANFGVNVSRTKTDEKLAVQARRDPDVFGILLHRYEAALTRFIRRISNIPAEEVEDVLQEAFLKAYRNLNAFDEDRSFNSWIYRIVRNETISAVRKVKVRNHVSIDLKDEDGRLLAEVLEDPSAENPHERADQVMEIEQLRQVIHKLPVNDRDILILRFLEEKSYREISDILRKPEGTIAARINRAKKKLYKIYQSASK